ncbi:MAG: glycosyltransferase [Phycisphaerales bacterium]|nr:glycosyltransferase [Phycisphaerales bacterium]
MIKRLAIFVTHPIQYYAPMWRRLAMTPGLEPVLHFFSDHSARGGLDSGFGVNVAWDIPLIDGYEHRFLERTADLSRPRTVALPQARQLLADGKFDAVMIHGYTHAFERDVVRAARALRLPVLMRGEFTDVTPDTGRTRIKSLVRDFYLKWFYRHVDVFCYIGEEARLHLQRRGIDKDRMFFSPYSVDTALFENQRAQFDRRRAREELGIDDGQTAVLFSGKLIPRKEPLLLVNALALLPDRQRVSLIVVGEGELRQQVESEARALLGTRLTMAGFVNQSRIGKYFMAADVFVLPSKFETWGLVVNEAMQFGLPVIASSMVGCHKDLIVSGKTGFTFPMGDSEALSARIGQLADDRDLSRRMGRDARSHVARYSDEASAAGIVAALRCSRSQ